MSLGVVKKGRFVRLPHYLSLARRQTGFSKVDTINWSIKRDSASLIVTNHSALS